MTRDPYWNHNTQYHPWLLRQAPSGGSALDIGCGDGLLARKLAGPCASVLGVDLDGAILETAPTAANVEYRQGDFRELDGTFDYVTAVATVHHVPLAEGFAALRRLVAPGGVLAVVGLWKMSPRQDFHYLPLIPAIRVIDLLRGGKNDPQVVVRDADETLGQIRTAAREYLPGAAIRRRLMWRYTLLWRNV
ncbi:class I SAM-dependent methyltransferase [Nocardia panacis]|uniref:Class I SAM-dependent methyltransferase n=1 Tax=Nocardia panacis TaxID=2340916 RepID=A0A3A4KGB0_9NOCA|nr:class I SAM-dependent methyltransferase [Nocardia panacis]RJO78344.1 class I SAM-dependent methyltransferase [Nocardia panacis]